MARREKRRARRKIFGRTAMATNTKNLVNSNIPRGGIRL